MVQLRSDSKWLKRGQQRSAVAQILRRPMTPSEIWHAAQTIAPRIQLRDVWFILRQMEQRGLVTCFNPQDATGKVFYWSAASKKASPTVNWHHYAQVARARNRRLVLLELTRRDGQSGSRIRRRVNDQHPVSLNGVIRALKELVHLHLIEISGEGYKRGQKLYRLSPAGKKIAEVLTHRTDPPQSLLNPAGSQSA